MRIAAFARIPGLIWLPISIIGLLACLALTFPHRPHGSAGTQEIPYNVLLLVADDLGNELGFLGDKNARTPNLDALSEQMVVFTNAYATTSSCSPSRSSLYTGLYPHSTGQLGLAPGFAMQNTMRTLQEMCQGTGYATGYMGKVHVEPKEKMLAVDLVRTGLGFTRDFDRIAMYMDRFINHTDTVNQPWMVAINVYDPHRDKREFLPVVNGLPEHPVTASQMEALPFQGVDTEEQRREIAGYYNSVTRLDAGIGMLFEVLRNRGQLDRTIVVITSDHGPPFARGKTSLYEAGTKVPLMIYHPDGAIMPHHNPALVSLVDVLPTLLESMGQPLPEIPLHGKSLLPLLYQQQKEVREAVVTEFTYHADNAYYPRRAIRQGNYKLIVNVDTTLAFPFYMVDGDRAWHIVKEEGPNVPEHVQQAFDRYVNPPHYELYDLGTDAWEFVNLATQPGQQARIQEMLNSLQGWQQATGDTLRLN